MFLTPLDLYFFSFLLAKSRIFQQTQTISRHTTFAEYFLHLDQRHFIFTYYSFIIHWLIIFWIFTIVYAALLHWPECKQKCRLSLPSLSSQLEQ